MAAYDPKRPRPSTGSSEEPAPVDALLDPSPSTGSTQAVRIDEPPPADGSGSAGEPESAGKETVEVDLRDPSSNGPTNPNHVVGPEVPVAAAPDEGTANRAVMIAALTAAGVFALIVAILLLRRRRVD